MKKTLIAVILAQTISLNIHAEENYDDEFSPDSSAYGYDSNYDMDNNTQALDTVYKDFNEGVVLADATKYSKPSDNYHIPPMSAQARARYIAKINAPVVTTQVARRGIYQPIPSPTTRERNNDILPGVNRYTVRREINNQYLSIPGEAFHALNGQVRQEINNKVYKAISDLF